MRPNIITATCGHAVTVAPTATVRARKLTATRPCADCHRHQQAADTLAASRRLGLRLLSGTDRQVAWSYAIRHAAVWKAAALLVGYRAIDTQVDAVLLAELVAAANTHPSAGYWIGVRRYAAEALLADCDYTDYAPDTAPLCYGATPEPEQYAPAPF